jgi:hypothetical protein
MASTTSLASYLTLKDMRKLIKNPRFYPDNVGATSENPSISLQGKVICIFHGLRVQKWASLTSIAAALL